MTSLDIMDAAESYSKKNYTKDDPIDTLCEGFINGAEWAQKQLESENAALRQQVKDMGEVIKELRTSFILDSIDVRFDGITVKGEDRILSLTLSRKS